MTAHLGERGRGARCEVGRGERGVRGARREVWAGWGVRGGETRWG